MAAATCILALQVSPIQKQRGMKVAKNLIVKKNVSVKKVSV